jgi:hypothetical protein
MVQEDEEGREEEEEEEEEVALVMVSRKDEDKEGEEEVEEIKGVARCRVLSTLSFRKACACGDRPIILSMYTRAFSGAGARTAAKTTNSTSLIISLLRFSRAIPARSSEAK